MPDAVTRLRSPLALLLASVWALGAWAQDAAPRSPRIASYTIEASLDADARLIAGRQTVRWRNDQATATEELWFHLWWNAWRNSQSTFMVEDEIRGRSDRGDDIRDDDWSWMTVDALRLAGGQDLLPAMRYAAPDDGNPDDRTVMVVTLPQPVAPGDSVELEIAWRAKVPRTFARTGHWGDYFFIAHWFPQLGVYEPEGWNCHQFHAATEFFADYGVYDVTLELPADFVLGASGRLLEETALGDGRRRHRYRAEDVHGFTWTASPDYLVREDRFEVPGLPPVDLRLLIQPEHQGQAARHLHATKATLEHYGRWYGPYPYANLTIVDPAFGSGAGGMEYPTLFTCGTRNVNPFGGGSPEGVTIHEAGHQFWYGVVGNNEIEHAWLDEGLNTFSTARAFAETYGRAKLYASYFNPPGTKRLRGFVRVLFDEAELSREVYGNRFSRFITGNGPTMDPAARPTFEMYPKAAGSISYQQTALWLATLEKHLGWDRLQGALSDFYRQWSFRHPRPDDFFAVLEESTGEDLDWFVDQIHRRSVRFDYAVASVSSKPTAVRGFLDGAEGTPVLAEKPDRPDPDAAQRYRSEVVVRRHGDGIFPVTVLLVFEDGSEERRAWDGVERWQRFVSERESKLAYAAVDPDRVLMLDLDNTNNSCRLRADAGFGARKWGAKWMVWLQDLLTTYTFFL